MKGYEGDISPITCKREKKQRPKKEKTKKRDIVRTFTRWDTRILFVLYADVREMREGGIQSKGDAPTERYSPVTRHMQQLLRSAWSVFP